LDVYAPSEMTDSADRNTSRMPGRSPDKRQRLVASAGQLLHEQGVEKTTLADIAQVADVPVGNIYYYFKTKDELLSAVIDDRAQEFQGMIASLEKRRTPKGRLKALVDNLVSQSDLVARYGCPIGSLCSELDKRPDGLDRGAANLLALLVDYVENQFHLMGREDARDLAVALIAAYQGIALLTNSFRDPELMIREGRRLDRWIDSLA
jgi:TetR/AcrR family transcriptional regulator, transcriptional repressor for nem operon